MKTFSTSGTLGDAYITCCKLSVLKDTPISVIHYTAHTAWHDKIREIYSLLPNVEVTFCNNRDMYNARIHSYFASKDDEDIGYNPFPEFEFEDCEIPSKPYLAVCAKSGKDSEDWRKMPRHIVDSLPMFTNCDTMISISPNNNTTLKQAFFQVANSSEFHGMQGIMCFVALSCKVPTTIYYNKDYEERAIKVRIPPEWDKYVVDILRI